MSLKRRIISVAVLILGVLILIAGSLFPLRIIYSITFEQMMRMTFHTTSELDPNLVRLKITIFSFAVAGVIILSMYGLRQASRRLKLTLFDRVLKWSMYYVGITTLLMVTSIWLDFHLGEVLDKDCIGSHHRLGFFFYHVYSR